MHPNRQVLQLQVELQVATRTGVPRSTLLHFFSFGFPYENQIFDKRVPLLLRAAQEPKRTAIGLLNENLRKPPSLKIPLSPSMPVLCDERDEEP